MPRHNRRRIEEAPVRRSVASERREQWRGEDYVVRALSAAAALKAYRCPGCDHEIRAGVPHLVAWPVDEPDAGNRRHWHAVCWTAREYRKPTRR